MGLNIVACIKQTPATTSIQLDAATGKIITQGLTYGINPLDEYALEEALRIKERVPGSWVAVLTLGRPQASDALREALARGADSAYHLSDEAFVGSDTYGTSYLLAQGIKKIQTEKSANIDIVLCAKQTNDGDSGQVGPAIAVWLGWPNVAYVRKIQDINAQTIRVERTMEDGTDVLEMDLPALLSVVKEINEPRLPSLKGKMASKKAVIPTWKAADIGADASKIGEAGSLTKIWKRQTPPVRTGGVRIEGATAEEKAVKFVEKIKELKLL
ncbi:MAG: electron transfer flavoprotein subunit beta/FixA family protein [Elusimicrobiota bacterium]